jgi:phosphopantothenoylcysteine synthetase/decarboxylase
MNAENKKELVEIKETIIAARLKLDESHKKLDDIVTNEEGEVDSFENADTDKNIARADTCQRLREATDALDEALEALENEVIGVIEEAETE